MSIRIEHDNGLSQSLEEKAEPYYFCQKVMDSEVESECIKEVVSSFSGSVVALASFNAYREHSTCTGVTGVVIKKRLILTSARLFTSLDDDSKIDRNLVVRVHLPNGQQVRGFYDCDNPHYNLAIVSLPKTYPGIQATNLGDSVQFRSDSSVVGVGRFFDSGKLKATAGMITREPNKQTAGELMTSTCNSTMLGIGGPLYDFDGNFVGMSACAAKGTTPFVPRSKIQEWLTDILVLPSPTLRVGMEQGNDSTIKRSMSVLEGSSRVLEGRKSRSRNKNQKSSITSRRGSEERVYHEYRDPYFEKRAPPLPVDKFTDHLTKSLQSRGYPLPITLDGGMRLLNSFEEEFAGDIWKKLKKNVAFNISQSVVSLASFSGESRFFACTGVLLGRHKCTTRVLTSASLVRTSADANKIADNLKIQVYLPNNRCAKGKLQHYNLHHNIALVTIRGFHCLRTAKFHEQLQVKPHRKVVAIGRVFQTGNIMATSGVLIDGQSKLDCQELMISTCKITKAGIGGPLIDFAGNFIGMNFYGTEESPYLPGNVILKLLRHFDAKRTVAVEVVDPNPIRWPVPEPCWHYPSSVYRIYQSHRTKQ